MSESRLNRDSFPKTPDNVHAAVLNALDQLDAPVRRGTRTARIPARRVVALAACLCLLGATAIAAGAVLSYRERMEAMSAEQLQSGYTIALNGEALAFNRALSEEETALLDELTIEYEDGLFPEQALPELDGQPYGGEGVALDAEQRMVYLPEVQISREEALQIIDYSHKSAYSIYRVTAEHAAEATPWLQRMNELSDADIDDIYLAAFSAGTDITGAYSRELSADEQQQYNALTAAYEAGSSVPAQSITQIDIADDYTGEGVAFCVENSGFYLTQQGLSDEEMLQIIDFEHKIRYAVDEIGRQIDLGLRSGYPGVE